MTTIGRIRKWTAVATLALGISAGATGIELRPANAAGCWQGMVVGAVVGHLAGHHAVLGLVAGCAIGKIAYGEWTRYKVNHPDVSFKQYLAQNKDKYQDMLTAYAGGNATVEGSGQPAPKSQ
jgi:hypothetical protein